MARHATAQPARKLRVQKNPIYLLFCISIKATKARRELKTRREISKKRSKPQKITSGEKTKRDKMTKHPKERTLGHPSRMRKIQKQQERKRAKLATAKQPLPAFFLFMAQHRPQLRKTNPRWTAVKTVKKLGKLWHQQPEKNKEMYKEEAAWLRRNELEYSMS